MENKIKNATEARAASEAGAEKNFENVINQIDSMAKTGVRDVTLLNPVSLSGVKRLIELGFTVSEFFHPFEQRNIQKVSW